LGREDVSLFHVWVGGENNWVCSVKNLENWNENGVTLKSKKTKGRKL